MDQDEFQRQMAELKNEIATGLARLEWRARAERHSSTVETVAQVVPIDVARRRD